LKFVRKRAQWISLLSMFSLAGAAFGSAEWRSSALTAKEAAVQSQHPPLVQHHVVASAHASPQRVVLIGGSVALGWDDKVGGGYLIRGWKQYAAEKKVAVTVVNASIEGDGPDKFASKLATTLSQAHAQILVISWGMLDSISAKTPLSVFQSAVATEIQAARAAGMDVIVVTPPPTIASYTSCLTSEPQYIAAEVAAARQYPSADVQVLDLFQTMKTYLATHHETIQSQSADGWHPNTAGHALAGQLLSQALLQTPEV
jgi:acyl-CoA thioesterase I